MAVVAVVVVAVVRVVDMDSDGVRRRVTVDVSPRARVNEVAASVVGARLDVAAACFGDPMPKTDLAISVVGARLDVAAACFGDPMPKTDVPATTAAPAPSPRPDMDCRNARPLLTGSGPLMPLVTPPPLMAFFSAAICPALPPPSSAQT